MEKTILIVEDEVAAAEILRDYLAAAGFSTYIITHGDQVVSWVRDNRPALVLLDIMLPGKDGISICRELRVFSELPVIMTTARVEEIDRLLGLELGADDYICKPYSPREVVARVKAVLRRTEKNGGGMMIGGIELDDESSRALIDGQPLELTSVEFKLLKALASRPGRIFSRNQLIDAIYTDRRSVSERTVDSHVKKLRMKIAVANPGLDCIHSVYGLGYKFDI